jgi:hypothetical protein
MAKDHERLEQVEDELAAARRDISHERRQMDVAAQEGHPTRPMERTLHALHHFRRALAQHRRILLERLGLYRP